MYIYINTHRDETRSPNTYIHIHTHINIYLQIEGTVFILIFNYTSITDYVNYHYVYEKLDILFFNLKLKYRTCFYTPKYRIHVSVSKCKDLPLYLLIELFNSQFLIKESLGFYVRYFFFGSFQ